MGFETYYGTQASTAEVNPVALVVSILVAVFYIIVQWKLFTKAGKPGWAILIPIYNCVVTFQIVYGKGWKFLLCLVPILGQILMIAYTIRLAQVYGKDVGFAILNLFFPFVTMPMLAFGSATYVGPVDSFL